MSEQTPVRPIWFKAKEFGYGWYPATWQGWLILVIYLMSLGFNIQLGLFLGGPDQWMSWLIAGGMMVFDTVVLIFICYTFGEPAKWRWGGKS